MIKTIFFDIGGVLLDIHPEKTIAYLAKLTNLSEKEVLDAFPADAHHQYERGEISGNEFYKAFHTSLLEPNGLTELDFWKAWGLLVGDETNVMNIMNSLSETYPVWLLSNTNPYHIMEEERFKLFDKITGGIYSFEVGSRKPEERIFHRALQIAKVRSEESLFIDDLVENVDRAKELGFNTIHFTSVSALTTELAKFNISSYYQ